MEILLHIEVEKKLLLCNNKINKERAGALKKCCYICALLQQQELVIQDRKLELNNEITNICLWASHFEKGNRGD